MVQGCSLITFIQHNSRGLRTIRQEKIKTSKLNVVVQSLSHVQSATPWTAACQASLSFTISQSLLKFMSIEWVMPPSNLIHCHPLLLLPPGFPSIRVFSNELALHIRWPRYWSFSISPSRKYSGLISVLIDSFDLLAVQGMQESSIAPQFESINSLVPSLLYGSKLTSVHVSHICTWLLEKT